MAKIIDPDDLTVSATDSQNTPTGNLFIDPTTTPKRIELIPDATLIAADGVTGQALYSKLKEVWKNDATLIKYPFPMEAITSEQFEFIADWELDDTFTASRTYIRDAGWVEKDAAATPAIKRGYVGVITLGDFADNANQTAYHYWAGDTAPVNFTYAGPVNEAVQYFGNATNGNFDHTTDLLTVAIRPTPTGTTGNVVGYTFDSSDTVAIGTGGSVTYQAYRFPLSSSVDLNISLTDAEASALEGTHGLTITWNTGSSVASSSLFTPDLVGGPYNFEIVVNATSNTVTRYEVYNWVQWSLRQGNADIDDGAGLHYAFSTPELMTFVGSQLQTFDIDTVSSTNGGVVIAGFNPNDKNDIKFRDDNFSGSVLRGFAYTATGQIVVNNNLINDAAAKVWMYDSNFPGATTVLVQDFLGSDIVYDVHYATPTGLTGSTSGSDGVTTVDTTTFSSATGGWDATGNGELAGEVLVITNGTDVTGYYFIVSNTATTITVDRAFEGSETALTYVIRAKNTTGEVPWDYDWTTNGDTTVNVVAIGLRTGQYVTAGFQIIEATNQSFPITAALERNYNDPV